LKDVDAYIIVGIGGDSGAGKTTFSNGIRRLMGEDMVSGFSMDDYHKEDRETRKETGHLPLDPDYNHLDLLAEHLRELRKGRGIVKPVYNHTTGTLDPQVVFEPKRITIIEGLHPFYTPELREGMDLKVFVDPVRNVKWKWKLSRDVEKRGHDRDEAFREILSREPLFKLFIDVQKVYADITVRIEPSRYSDDSIENPQVKLIMTGSDISAHNIDINLDLAGLLGGSRKFLSLEFGRDYYFGRSARMLTIDGLMPNESLLELQERICAFTGTKSSRLFDFDGEHVNPSGMAQLVVAWWFLEKLHKILSDLEHIG
jgi:phosphoribulokinase